MSRRVLLGELVEETDPTLIGCFILGGDRAARDRDAARPDETAQIVEARPKNAEPVAPEDRKPAPRRGLHMLTGMDRREAPKLGCLEHARAGENQADPI